jgi:hypothetical protein
MRLARCIFSDENIDTRRKIEFRFFKGSKLLERKALVHANQVVKSSC